MNEGNELSESLWDPDPIRHVVVFEEVDCNVMGANHHS